MIDCVLGERESLVIDSCETASFCARVPLTNLSMEWRYSHDIDDHSWVSNDSVYRRDSTDQDGTAIFIDTCDHFEWCLQLSL